MSNNNLGAVEKFLFDKSITLIRQCGVDSVSDEDVIDFILSDKIKEDSALFNPEVDMNDRIMYIVYSFVPLPFL